MPKPTPRYTSKSLTWQPARKSHRRTTITPSIRMGVGDRDRFSLALRLVTSIWRIRILYKCIIYLENYNKTLTHASFSYTLKGQQYQKSLRYEGMKTLVLSKSDLKSLPIKGASEGLRAVTYHVMEQQELGMDQSQNPSNPIDDRTFQVSLTINLKKDAPCRWRGQYDISDWLPSNSRLYGTDSQYPIRCKQKCVFLHKLRRPEPAYIL